VKEEDWLSCTALNVIAIKSLKVGLPESNKDTNAKNAGDNSSLRQNMAET
jgi:hypothetical protein